MNHGDTSTQQSISDHPLTQEEVIAAKAKITANKDKKEKTPIFPVPVAALPCSFALPKIGKPTALYPYHNAAGQLLGYIARFDTVNPETGERQKIILPVCFCELSNGKRGWRSVGMPKPRPLYNLSEIMARADAAILVGEGEKVAEAGKLLFPNYVSTTPMHGAQSPQHTDWGEDDDNRIDNGSPHDRRVVQRAGFKRLNASKEWEYFILPEIFEQEIIGSLPEAKVKPYLAERRLIMRDSQNKYTVSIRVPGFKQARLYHIPASVLSGNEPDGVADGAGVAIKNTATPTSMPAAQPCVSMQFKQKEGVSSSATPQTQETPPMQPPSEEWQEQFEERAAIIEFDNDPKGA